MLSAPVYVVEPPSQVAPGSSPLTRPLGESSADPLSKGTVGGVRIPWEGDVFIRMLTGKILRIRSRSDSDVIWLKTQLRLPLNAGIPVASQRLVFNSKIMEDHNTLDACGVVAGSTLTLVGDGKDHRCFGRCSRCPPVALTSKLVCLPCSPLKFSFKKQLHDGLP